MITTSFQNGQSYSKFDAYYEDDDYMTADDYDRDGWEESKYDRQYY
jgi:hypothetical protein